MKLSRGKIILILILMSISISILVYSFAYTTTTHVGDDSNYISVSEISFGLNDSVESISLGNQTPTIDKFGVTNDSFSFSITNMMGTEQQYTLRLVDKETVSTIVNEEIRYQLTRNGIVEEIKNLPNSGIIDTGVIAKGETYDYSIVVWLGHDAVTTGGTWDKVIKVEAGNVNIDSSGANEPILLDNMIPVYYDEDDETWKKADKTNSNLNYRWYDYDARIWANAVTVYSTTETDYLSEPEGTEILMEDILMFYVWIPRFKYDLFESGSPKLINVTFEKGIENTGTMKCNRENGVETCVGEKTSYTHPAFTFDGEELTGYWINKFELSPESSTTCYNDVTSNNCNKNNLTITSKPNQNSLRYISVENLFYSIRNMELSENIYGFSNVGLVLNDDGSIEKDNNNYDIHLSRNFETAALSYLTYSQYGKYSNINYNNNERFVFSNNSNAKTGSSYINNNEYTYNTKQYGTGASTTGNIYGVYDLNGKVYEYVMSNKLDTNKSNIVASSGFSEMPLNKYYDVYSSNTDSLYGDTVNELNGFTDNSSDVLTTSKPFMVRKSVDSVSNANGQALENYGGRSVITIDQDIYITKW